MSAAHAELVNFVSAIARCRQASLLAPEEEIPAVPLTAQLKSLASGRGLESLYLSFDKINHTHKYKGRLGYCYREAYRLAMSDPNFIYCEGYAISAQLSIPLSHAWCVHRETKEVYDPVWNTKKVRGSAYCGIPLDLRFVNAVIVLSQCYGILDQVWRFPDVHDTLLSAVIHPAYHNTFDNKK